MNEQEPRPLDDARDADQLVTVATAATEFQASLIVTQLADAGVEALAFGAVHGSLPLSARRMQVPVQVRRHDLERALAALAQKRVDSAELDWDSVDVGDRDDRLPTRPRRGMPMLMRIGFVLAVALVLLLLAGFVAALIAALF